MTGQAWPVPVSCRRPTDQQSGSTQVAVLEVVYGTDGRLAISDDHRVGRATQGSRHGRFIAVLYVEECGDRAEQPSDLVAGGEQGTRAVLAAEPHLERVATSG